MSDTLSRLTDPSPTADDYLPTSRGSLGIASSFKIKLQDMKVTPTGGTADTLANLFVTAGIGGTTNAITQRLTTTDGVASGTAKVVGGMAFSDVAASDVVTAAVSNNAFVSFAQTYAIPASTLKSGSLLRIRAQVTINNASGSDTLTCNIRVGGTSLIATTAVDPGATTDHHILEFNFVARAAPGATASCAGYGRWTTNTGGTLVHGTAMLAPTNFATNGALTVDVQAKWSSNTANTSARLEVLNVEII